MENSQSSYTNNKQAIGQWALVTKLLFYAYGSSILLVLVAQVLNNSLNLNLGEVLGAQIITSMIALIVPVFAIRLAVRSLLKQYTVPPSVILRASTWVGILPLILLGGGMIFASLVGFISSPESVTFSFSFTQTVLMFGTWFGGIAATGALFGLTAYFWLQKFAVGTQDIWAKEHIQNFFRMGGIVVAVAILLFAIAIALLYQEYSRKGLLQEEFQPVSQDIISKEEEELQITQKVEWPEGHTQEVIIDLQRCSSDGLGCIIAAMDQHNASKEVIDFFNQTRWFVAKFRDFGAVDLLDIFTPWRANHNDDYAFVNGSPSPIILEDEAHKFFTQQYTDDATKIFPEYIPWATDGMFVKMANNAFQFRFPLQNGCHACSTGYWVVLSLSFNEMGTYKGANVVGYCTDETKTDSKFVSCTFIDSEANGQQSGTYNKPEWGISFRKPANWETISDTNEKIELEQTSGEWVGDRMDISFLTGSTITTDDAKFGSLTYYYDENSERWMRQGSALEYEGVAGPVPAAPYSDYSYTEDGLPVFVGTTRWATFIIPLSHTSFLKLHITGSGYTQPLRDMLRTVRTL
ncbi:MAG: SoxR reducing system RseC family protein [bacterium]|nr:SoxR reducing system RseC family protein [bacterium]